MSATKRLTNLSDYKSVLPYSSEVFGIYQPMTGWKSKRAKAWTLRAARRTDVSLIDRFTPYFQNRAMIEVNADCAINAEGLVPADFRGPRLIEHNSVLLKEVRKSLVESPNVPDDDRWHRQINQDTLSALLSGPVGSHYNDLSIANCRSMARASLTGDAAERARRENALSIERALGSESEIAGVLLKLLEARRTDLLLRIFYDVPDPDGKSDFSRALKEADAAFVDPFLTFDRKKECGRRHAVTHRRDASVPSVFLRA